jgi:hypothetical protein
VVLAEELPDILDRVQLGRIGRQRQQAEVVGHLQLAARLVPAGAVERDDGVRARRDLAADLGEVLIHGVAVGDRRHQAGLHTADRADGTEQVGPAVALVARRGRTATLVGPHPRQVPC